MEVVENENSWLLNRMAMEIGGRGITATAVGLLENSAIGGKIVAVEATFSRKKFAE
jgi:hypothetical protein